MTNDKILSQDAVMPKAFAWWPRSRIGSIVQVFILLFLFWLACPKSFALWWYCYEVIIGFLIITGARYGWFCLDLQNRGCAQVVWWKNPAYLAIAACFIYYVIMGPLFKFPDNK